MREQNLAVELILLSGEVGDAIRVVDGPLFVDDGGLDYVCAACGARLCFGMHEGELAGLALTCGCGWSSRVPSSTELPRRGGSAPQVGAAT